jgi:hypothetical protein
MALECAQVNLADLMAGWTDKRQPWMRGSDPQMKPQLAALCEPTLPYWRRYACLRGRLGP